ncbi:MAG: T9SS type A sorting domain-containing protein, partial [Bacteroidales bacterium]|nr:T9SS type A sorting domain-containing protein [Bacteroidales bacterium]
SVSTNAAGEFTLDNIVSGLVFVKVNAAGYHSKSIIVDLENTETETVAFRLEKIEAVLEENFDGTVFPPTGWTQTITNTANTWIQDNLTESFSDIDATNVYSALCPWVDEDQDEWLKSPAFSLSDGLYSLEFYAGFDPYWLSSATLKLNISTDGGTNWTKIWEANNDGQEWVWRLITLDLSSYANNANVMLGWQYVGNNGDWVGIDNVSLVSGTTGLIEQEFEKEYSLAQNYPNPFTDQTTISFQLDDPKHINLTIYNSIGQKIAEPFNEKLNSGKHQYIFDATGLKAGIYYYRLTIDGQGSAIPMILSK